MPLRIESNEKLLIDSEFEYTKPFDAHDDEVHRIQAIKGDIRIELGWVQGYRWQTGGRVNDITLTKDASTYTLTKEGVEMRVISDSPPYICLEPEGPVTGNILIWEW